MRSIIDGLPPRSGDRIFPKTEHVFGLATSPPIFFGGVPQPNTAQLPASTGLSHLIRLA